MNVNNVLIIPGFGPSEMMIIAFIVMLLFGAKKLPELARSLGKSKGEFEKGKHDSESNSDSESKVESKSNSVTKSREEIEKAAKELGIDPVGKSDSELRDAIKQNL
jgi:sec-independent protein translocase protein TatA|tara:strand:+ start:42 stop:359 length:318 start_codon:yes stop_codon:yes gene_type:complete